VPDRREMNPWIAVSGMMRSEIPAAKLDMIVERAKTRGRTDQRVDEVVRRTLVSLGEDLRFIAGGAVRKSEPKAAKFRVRTTDALLILLRDSKQLAIAVLAGLGLLAVAIYAAVKIFWKLRMTLVPRKFPDVSWKRRFGAPYGGIVYTSSPKKRNSHEIR
ncbi:MAG TPA: hypothetical protein VM511_09700, partial [Luteolibacter sp.]|nr:hypothetical protein [Luteolibacter sp.]